MQVTKIQHTKFLINKTKQMKKLLLVITLLFVYTIASYAQSTNFTVFSAKMAELNTYTNEWIWEAPHDVTMSVVVTDTKVYVEDKNNSVYTIINDRATTKTTYNSKVITYKAYDESGKRCNIELVSWTDKTLAPQMYIVYSDTRYAYSIITKL